jgi:hypothetical protein
VLSLIQVVIVITAFHVSMEGEALPCARCGGTGLGPVDGTACIECGGRGELDPADLDDRTFDDDAFDRWRDERDFAGVAA